MALGAVLLAACSGSDDASRGELTDAEVAWCAEHPFEHGEAARRLDIPFVGDYIRESGTVDESEMTAWEPPLLAVPSDGQEPLTYIVQFENQRDSDQACRAAFEQG